MQQTETLNLKLIEGTDDVDWTVFNDNFEALEEETADIRSDMADSLSSLSSTVQSGLSGVTAALGTGGSTCRIAYGSCAGTGSAQTLNFDFVPVAVFLTAWSGSGYNEPAVLVRGVTGTVTTGVNNKNLSISSWGTNSVTFSGSPFNSGTVYYAAIGVSE